MSHRIIVINDYYNEVKGLRDMAEIIDGNWTNYTPAEQSAIEAIIETFEAWKKDVGSAHVASACDGLEAYLPPQD